MIQISSTATARLAAAKAAATAALQGGDRAQAADLALHAAGEISSFLIAMRAELDMIEARAAALDTGTEPTNAELKAILAIDL